MINPKPKRVKLTPKWIMTSSPYKFTYRALLFGPHWVVKAALDRWQVYRMDSGGMALLVTGKNEDHLNYVQSFATLQEAKDFVEVMWRMET